MQILDTITYGFVVTFIVALFGAAAVEVKKSLIKTRGSEKKLRQEKEVLVKKIEVQQEELKKSENTRLSELAQVAEFGRLSQGLFHDLMTPLSSIILHTEKLKTIPKEELESTQRTLEKAIGASERMAAYIQTIRNTLHKEQPERECDMQEEMTNVLDLLRYKSRAVNAAIMVNGDANIPKNGPTAAKNASKLTWFGNPLQLRQIFTNLVSNALDSFEEISDGRKCMVEIALEKEAGAYKITVTDNGIGIPRENLQKIFEPFFTTKSLEKGTGIGLATVKTIVEDTLHGNINVESTVGKGTSFVVTLPF